MKRVKHARRRAYVAGFAQVAVVAALILIAGPTIATTASAQDAVRPLFDRLIGDWRGSGTVTGRASELTLQWSREVSGMFLHLRFRNAMAASATRPAEVFEGRGYYRLTAASAATGSGTWLDSRGVIFPVVVSVTADALTSDWGSETTERGRTVYRLVTADAMDVIDSVRSADGQYREFGRSRVTRASR